MAITFDLLAGTNQVRNLHAVAPLTIQLANDNWTLSFSVDSYSTAQTDALLLPKASEAWVTTQLGGYYTIQGTDDAITAALTNHFTRAEATANLVAGITECKDYTDTSLLDYSDTAQMNQAIADALVPFGTIVQRDAAIAAALAAYYTSAQTDSAIAAGLATIDLSPYWTIAQVQAAITAALVPVTLSNGQSWTGGPTFNLLRGSNVLRNLSVAGALTATFQNLDDTILIESDSYARSETYTQLETGAAITAALDALNLSQYRTEAQVLALIAGELVPYWDQSEVSSFVAGELSNYATNSSVSSSISSALSSYDSSSQVDNKIITALLDFYTRAETDQAIADAVSGGTDLSAYYTSAQTDQEIADAIAGLVGVYVRWTELQAPIINEINIALLDYDTSAQVDAKISGAGFLDQTAGDARYFVRAPGAESGQIWNLVQEQFTPRIVRNLLLEAPLVGDAILGNQSTLRIRSDSWSKAEADSRFLRTNDLGPLDARYFPVAPGAEGSGIYNLIQTQFTPNNPEPAVPNSPLRPAHPGQRQHPPDLLRLLEQRSERRPLPPHRQFQQSGPAGHGPGEQSGRGPRGGPHRQQPHGHELRGHAAAAERSGRPPNPKRPGDRPQGGRRPAGLLRGRRHQPGPGRHGGRGQHAQRDDGGFRPATGGQHGRQRRLQFVEQRHRQSGGS